MTTELKRAMARYEEARIQYRKAVLASLDGASNGDAIRAAIQRFQAASADLRRLEAQAREEIQVQNEPASVLGWDLFRRFLKAG